MKLEIVFEDPDLILCSKPSGILSEEGGMPQLLRESCGAEEIYCVHRLDKAAGGLMVYARTRQAAADLSRQIREGCFEKRYLAVVCGAAEARGSMRDLLYRDAAKNKSYVVRRTRRGVREAELRYETLQRTPERSLVRIQLLTGRSHQIRVQFASRKLPLAGDGKYGSPERDCPLALWSESLRFLHPRSGEVMEYRISPPAVHPWTLFSI